MCWCKSLVAPGRPLITITFSVFLIVLASAPVSAQFYVRSPEVDKGEAEIEENGALYSGPGEDERLRQAHEIEGKYGITERFEVILEGELEQPIGEDLGGKAIELGGQYEIIKRHGDGLGVGRYRKIIREEVERSTFWSIRCTNLVLNGLHDVLR